MITVATLIVLSIVMLTASIRFGSWPLIVCSGVSAFLGLALLGTVLIGGHFPSGSPADRINKMWCSK